MSLAVRCGVVFSWCVTRSGELHLSPSVRTGQVSSRAHVSLLRTAASQPSAVERALPLYKANTLQGCSTTPVRSNSSPRGALALPRALFFALSAARSYTSPCGCLSLLYSSLHMVFDFLRTCVSLTDTVAVQYSAWLVAQPLVYHSISQQLCSACYLNMPVYSAQHAPLPTPGNAKHNLCTVYTAVACKDALANYCTGLFHRGPSPVHKMIVLALVGLAHTRRNLYIQDSYFGTSLQQQDTTSSSRLLKLRPGRESA